MNEHDTPQLSIPRQKNSKTKIASLALMAVLVITALGAAGAYALASSTASLNNVQVEVVTSANLPYSFIVSAYNSSGSLVSYTQTSYPAAAFELPNGLYLVTVTAYHYVSYPCVYCVTPMTAGGAPASKTQAIVSPPISIGGPDVEYGFVMEQVSGAQSITIQTRNASQIPTSSVSVKVTFANGTAALGAYVSASVVGQNYYYWDSGSNLSMYSQTDKSGVASLVVPSVPVELDAYLSVPITLPTNETTVQTTVGGQKINVTVYWQPMDVQLSGSALLVPPNTSAAIALHYQQPVVYYAPTPYNSGSGGYASTVTMTAQAGETSGQPASAGATGSSQGLSAPALNISPFSAQNSDSHGTTTQQTQPIVTTSTGGSHSSSKGSGSPATLTLVLVGVVATIAVVVVSVLVLRTQKR